jgi:hypothetical protein
MGHTDLVVLTTLAESFQFKSDILREIIQHISTLPQKDRDVFYIRIVDFGLWLRRKFELPSGIPALVDQLGFSMNDDYVRQLESNINRLLAKKRNARIRHSSELENTMNQKIQEDAKEFERELELYKSNQHPIQDPNSLDYLNNDIRSLHRNKGTDIIDMDLEVLENLERELSPVPPKPHFSAADVPHIRPHF